MVHEVLANIPFAGKLETPSSESNEQGKETPVAPPADPKKPTEKTPSPDGDPNEGKNQAQEDEKIPFHKHPRWKQVIEERNQLRDAVGELQRFREEAEKKLNAPAKEEQAQSPNMPLWFSEVFGDNPPAWEKFQEYDQSLRSQIKSEVLGEVEAKQAKQQKETERWNDWVSEQVKNVEEAFDVDLADKDGKNALRNEFMAFMVKHRPTDAKGNLNFTNGWELFSSVREAKKAKPTDAGQARKELAAMTTHNRQADPSKKDFRTPNELRNKNWRDYFGS